MKKITLRFFFLFAITLFFANTLSAQIERISYTQDVKDFMNANISNGLNKYNGITSKVTIKFNEVKLISSVSADIIQRIQAIEGVLNCEISAETFARSTASTAHLPSYANLVRTPVTS